MTWHVAFTRDHCIVFWFDAKARVWIIVNPGAFAERTRALSRRNFDRWIRLLARRAEILRLDGHKPRPVLGLGFWCVGRAKKIMGFRSGALFPGGLRRDLLKAGAVRAFALPRST